MVPGATPGRLLTVDQTPQGFATLQDRLLATGHPAAAILVVMEATGSSHMYMYVYVPIR